MKILTNRAGAYLTGDDIADAVLQYGAALANEQRVDLVDIPYVRTDDHGSVGTVRLSVGWQIEVNAAHHPSEGVELIDHPVLMELSTRARTLHPSGDTPLTPDDIAFLDEMEDYDL